jgi:transmembrane sensor
MIVTTERTRPSIAEEAADWFVANRQGLDAARRRQFTAWLKASPIHVEEYLGIATLAQDLPRAAADPRVSLDALLERARDANDNNVREITPQVRTASGRIPRIHWLPAAAAALGLVGLSFLWWSSDRTTQPRESVTHYAAGHGEQLTQRLADGSVIHLNTDTSVAIRFGMTERRIDLESGQAMFEVAHDAAKPFRVIAGSAQIIDVGTKFDVYMRRGETQITIVEGRVRVSVNPPRGGRRDIPTSKEVTQEPLELTAGQQVRVEPGELSLRASDVDTQRATAWLLRRIVFEQEPLGVVVEEFNRYSNRPLEIQTPALKRLAISGSFAADDVESFVAFLRSLDGVRVEVTATRILVFQT